MPTSLTLSLVAAPPLDESRMSESAIEPLRLTEWSSASVGGPDLNLPLPGASPRDVWARLRYIDGWRLHCPQGTEVALNGGPWRSSVLLHTGKHRLTLRRVSQRHFLTAAVQDVPPTLPLTDGWLSIGTEPQSDFRVDGLDIDRLHAHYRRESDGSVTVRDRSRLGTFVAGQSVLRANVPDGGTFTVGVRTVRNTNGVLSMVPRERAASAAPLIAAEHLAAFYRDKSRGLTNVSFSLGRQELLAVIGPSGAGKSSLFKTLLGEIGGVTGTLTLHGDQVGKLPYTQAALVPQKDDLPSRLTIDQLLSFSMDLRSSGAATREAKAAQVEVVLKQLDLMDKRGSNVEKLSGGQLKRASVALELIAAPEILLLDEPTSGLDEGLDRALMTTLSDLTRAENGSGVLIVTHTMANLGIADRVLALARGGTTSHLGKPSTLLPAFGVQSHADVMLELAGQKISRETVRHHGDHGVSTRSSGRIEKTRRMRFPLWTLIRSEARRAFPYLPPEGKKLLQTTHGQFVRPFILNFLAIPILIVLAAWIAGTRGLDAYTGDGSPNRDLTIVISVLTIFTALICTALTTGQFVKDDGYLHRLHRWRIGTPAIVLARFGVQGAIAAGLTASTGTGFLLISHGPAPVESITGTTNVLVTLMLLGCASAAAGLAISSLTARIETAMYVMMGVAVFQVIFSGLLIPQTDWWQIGRMATWLLPTRWGVAALAAAADLNKVRGDQTDGLWTSDVHHVVAAWAALAAITFGSLLVAMVSLQFRLTKKS